MREVMREKRSIKKKSVLFLTIGVLFLNCFFAPELSGGIFPSEVSAKVSRSTKKKAVRAYRNFMYESDYTYFYMSDIDKDGLKELLVSYESEPNTIIIYKYRKNRVRRVGEDNTSFFYYRNKKTKRIHGVWGGAGNTQAWYLTINKSGKLRRVYLSRIEHCVKNGKPVYKYYYAGKKITKKAYLKKSRSWTKNYVPLKMRRTNVKNIKKYIR